MSLCLFPVRGRRSAGPSVSAFSLARPSASGCVLFPACRSGLLRPSVFQGLRPSSGAPFPVLFPPGAAGSKERRVLCPARCRAEDRTSAKAGSGRTFRVPTAPPNKEAFIPDPLQGRKSDTAKAGNGRAFLVATPPPKRYTFVEAKKLHNFGRGSCPKGRKKAPPPQDAESAQASIKVYLSKRPNGIFGAFIIPQNPDLSSPNVTNGRIFVMNGKKKFFRPRFQPVFSKNPSFSPPAGQS